MSSSVMSEMGGRLRVLALHAEQDVPGSVLYAVGQLLPADELQQALLHSVKPLQMPSALR